MLSADGARRASFLRVGWSRARLVSLALCALLGLGCKHRLGWVVVPSDAGPPSDAGSTATPTDDETLTRWSVITPGYCSLSPGTPIRSSSSGENAPPLPRGRYCFSSLLVRTFARPGVDSGRAPCQLEAAAAQSRLLPDEDGEVRLVEQPVLATERPAWDVVLAQVAGCAPRRAPERCSCPYAGDRAEECVPALSGDLIAFGDRHACVGRRGTQDLWCWGDESAFGGATTSMVSPRQVSEVTVVEALEQIEAAPGVTCARGAAGLVYCFAAGGEGVVQMSPDARVHAVDISLTRDVGCALGVVPGVPEIRVFCRWFTSPDLETVVSDARDYESISVGDGLACLRRGRSVLCAPTERPIPPATSEWGLEDLRDPGYLSIQLAGSYACGHSIETYGFTCSRIVDGRLGGVVFTTTPTASLSVSSDSVCMARLEGLACANWAAGPRTQDQLTHVMTQRGGLLTGRAGPGVVCGTPERGDGTLVCRSIGDSGIGLELLQAGSRYSAARSDAICPGP